MEDNIRMDHRVIKLEFLDWIHVARGRKHWDLDTVITFCSIKGGEFLIIGVTNSFSIRTLRHVVS
jgi:hypothetical protein